MTDIVELLRLTSPQDKTASGLLQEAADEIERLRDVLGKTERDLERALAALDHHLKADR